MNVDAAYALVNAVHELGQEVQMSIGEEPEVYRINMRDDNASVWLIAKDSKQGVHHFMARMRCERIAMAEMYVSVKYSWKVVSSTCLRSLKSAQAYFEGQM
jgi:hypothetical protein